MENNQLQNLTIICKDCQNEFTFYVNEQQFYIEKGFANPIRCKSCRDLKKKNQSEKNNDSNITKTENNYSNNNKAEKVEYVKNDKNESFEKMLAEFMKNTVKLEDLD